MRSSLQTDHRPLLTVVEGGDRVPAGQQDLRDLAGGGAEPGHHVQSHLAAAGVNTLQAEQQAGHRLGVGDDVVLEQLVELVQPGQGVSVSLALLRSPVGPHTQVDHQLEHELPGRDGVLGQAVDILHHHAQQETVWHLCNTKLGNP